MFTCFQPKIYVEVPRDYKMSTANNKLAPIKEAKETFQSLMEISRLLCTGLEPEMLAICVRLCEAGVNPEVLAAVVRELRKEVHSMQEQGNNEAPR